LTVSTTTRSSLTNILTPTPHIHKAERRPCILLILWSTQRRR
jgi:hypothetical protein